MTDEIKKNTLFDVLQLRLKNRSDLIVYIFIPLITTLFFIEAFRTYVPGIYIAIYHVIFQDEGWIGSLMLILTLLFFFIPLFTNYLCNRFGQKKMYLVSILSIAIVRVIIAFHLISLIETILAGVIVAFFGIFISIFLKRLVQNDLNLELKAKISLFSIAFIGAFLLDSVIRTIGFTLDISLVTSHLNPELWPSLQYLWLSIQVPLSLLLIWFSIRTSTILIPTGPSGITEELRNEPLILSTCGLGMFFFLIFTVFLYPNAIAQYTNTFSAIISPFLMASLILVIFYLLFVKSSIIYNIRINLCFNLILVLVLAAFLFLGKASPYPIGILTAFSIAIMFLNTHLLIVNMSTPRKAGIQISQFSKIITYGLLFVILMTVLHIFSTDHAFTIQAFQGFGPTILFIGGCIFALMTLLAHIQINQFTKGRAN